MHPILNIASTAALQAGKVILRYYDKVEHIRVSEKGASDFVSEADIKAQEIIIETIKRNHPDHAVVAEESGLAEIDPDKFTWIIDPLDGTTNFLHSIPHFCVSIAVMKDDQIIHGLVYDPIKDEMFTASRGSGAQLNQQRLKLRHGRPFDQAIIGTGFPYSEMDHLESYLHLFKTICPQVAGIRRMGAAALDLAYVAAGRFDGFWELGLQPWDLAAGALIVQEAGGFVSDIDGSENFVTSGNIVANHPKHHATMMGIISDCKF